MKEKPYGEIKGELEYFKFLFEQEMRSYLKSCPKNALDKMIDKATGYDKARDATVANTAIKLLCRIGNRQKLLGEDKDREITLKRIKELTKVGEEGRK